MAETVGSWRDAFAGAPDLAALQALFGRAARERGFTAHAAGFLPDGLAPAPDGAGRRSPFLLLDWPPAWLELYAARGYAADDVAVAEAAGTDEPFTWAEVRARRPGASDRIFAAAAAFGWRDGLVVPAHDRAAPAGERLAAVVLAAPAPVGPGRAEAAALARAAFARARALARAEAARPAFRLTAREAEALGLVAAGLGDPAIGRRMGVTRRTAHHHVESAKRRLGATSRAQAVALAVAKGLLPRSEAGPAAGGGGRP